MFTSQQSITKPDRSLSISSKMKGNIRKDDSQQGLINVLQRSFGNNALQNLTNRLPESVSPSYGNDLPLIQRKCACGGVCPDCKKQADMSLLVSQPGDPLEQQADQRADQILAKLESNAGGQNQKTRAMSDEDGIEEGEGIVDENLEASTSSSDKSTHSNQDAPSTVTPASLRSLPQSEETFASQLSAQYGQGQMLSSPLRNAIEPHLGYDLSAVRVYPREVDVLAENVDARAFTLGRNIYFRDGEYNPDSQEGMRVLLHELVHTTQTGVEMIQRTPSISGWRFRNSGNTAADNCCALCPAPLGVSSRSTFQNGMELRADIDNDEPGASFDIKRSKERSTWKRVGGVWTNLSHVGPGADDDSSNNDECLTPSTSPGHIYSEDQPGFPNSASFDAAATDMVYKASFTESVEIVDGAGVGRTDGNFFDWHTITWASQSGGTWSIDAARSEIASGSVTVGTTAP